MKVKSPNGNGLMNAEPETVAAECPHCGSLYEMAASDVGKVMACEVCKNEFTIVETDSAVAPNVLTTEKKSKGGKGCAIAIAAVLLAVAFSIWIAYFLMATYVIKEEVKTTSTTAQSESEERQTGKSVQGKAVGKPTQSDNVIVNTAVDLDTNKVAAVQISDKTKIESRARSADETSRGLDANCMGSTFPRVWDRGIGLRRDAKGVLVGLIGCRFGEQKMPGGEELTEDLGDGNIWQSNSYRWNLAQKAYWYSSADLWYGAKDNRLYMVTLHAKISSGKNVESINYRIDRARDALVYCEKLEFGNRQIDENGYVEYFGEDDSSEGPCARWSLSASLDADGKFESIDLVIGYGDELAKQWDACVRKALDRRFGSPCEDKSSSKSKSLLKAESSLKAKSSVEELKSVW